MAEASTRPPADRRLSWLFAAVAAVLLAAMPAWRMSDQPASATYQQAPDAFEAKVEAMVAAHATGEADEEVPVVRPPPGDVYMLARRWQFYPVLELQAGETYRLHVASVDIVHGFHLGGADLLLVPGQTSVVTVTPREGERPVIQCSEYCGLRHSRMTAWLRILPAGR